MTEPERINLEEYVCGKCSKEIQLVDGWWACDCYRVGAYELDRDHHHVPGFWRKRPDLWFTFHEIAVEMQGGPLTDPNQEKQARARLIEDWITLNEYLKAAWKQQEQLADQVERLQTQLQSKEIVIQSRDETISRQAEQGLELLKEIEGQRAYLYRVDAEIARLNKALGRLTNSSPALAGVLLERERQDAKWGEQNHDPFTYLTILMEEVGELAQAALHTRFDGDHGGLEHMREEAVQTAAVALAIVECLDRAKWQWSWTPSEHEKGGAE